MGRTHAFLRGVRRVCGIGVPRPAARPIALAVLAVAALNMCVLAGCAAPAPEAPTPVPAPTREPAGSGGRTNLPDPPPASPPPPRTSSAPPRATTPPPPSSPPVGAPSEPAPAWPVEFHVQVDDRGDRPAAKGLSRTLRWPNDLPVFVGTTRAIYEWRPDDGREKVINHRTTRPWGPIFKPSLAEQMEPDNLRRHLDAMGPWLDTWLPRDFEGVACFDVEIWDYKTDPFHLPPAELAAQREKHPGKSHGELLSEFIERTTERARALRPRVRAWGWYGLGGVHPGYVVWEGEKFGDVLTQARRDRAHLARLDVPMPVFYFPAVLTDPAQRALSWERCATNVVEGYGKERLRDRGYAYLNIRHHGGPRPDEALSREEFRECVEAARSAGLRRFIVWTTLEDRAARDRVQAFIDEAFTPVVRDTVATARREAAGNRPDQQPLP